MSSLFKLLDRYQCPTTSEKKENLIKKAEMVVQGKMPTGKTMPKLVFGVNEVVTAVEKKAAQLVVIANDVHPIEMVIFLPALCRKMDVPYCIVRDRARLGILTRTKKCTCVALTEVHESDKQLLSSKQEMMRKLFNAHGDKARRHWGGNIKPDKNKIKPRSMQARAARLAVSGKQEQNPRNARRYGKLGKETPQKKKTGSTK